MRVVSLVPSLTETLFALGLDSKNVVGRTPWCVHPSPEVDDVPVVGGTKTPTYSKIRAARPDIVVMDRDENPKDVHDWCVEQGYGVFVCDVRHPSEVPSMLRHLGDAVEQSNHGERLAHELEATLAKVSKTATGTVLPFIWHEPLMIANARTYAGGMLSTLGWSVPDIDPEGTGYPAVTETDLLEHGVEGLLMSSEPHAFSRQEGEAIAERVERAGGARPWVKCIDGEALTWMGARTRQGLLQLAGLTAPVQEGD